MIRLGISKSIPSSIKASPVKQYLQSILLHPELENMTIGMDSQAFFDGMWRDWPSTTAATTLLWWWNQGEFELVHLAVQQPGCQLNALKCGYTTRLLHQIKASDKMHLCKIQII